MRKFLVLLAIFAIAGTAIPVASLAQDNPCSGKAANPCNPCGGKAHAKNPCNPCGGKSVMHAAVAVNPCHAKMGTVFYVSDPMNRNSISFSSEAPLEDIVGTTNQVTGYVVFDPRHPDRGGQGMLTIPTASLTTGIPLRDEHLRSAAWLHAEESPQITFTLEEVKNIERVKEKNGAVTFEGTAKGKLEMRGRTKKLEAPVRFTYLPESEKTKSRLPGNLLAGRTSFEVKLKDFGVKGMGDVVGTKVAETIAVDVSFMGSTAAQMASNPCNPCGGKAKNPCNPCGGKAKGM